MVHVTVVDPSGAVIVNVNAKVDYALTLDQTLRFGLNTNHANTGTLEFTR